MEFSFFLTVNALVFLIILMMTFYSKELLNSTNTKLYRCLLILCLIFAITELVAVLISKFLKLEILTTILFRFHCGVGFLWVGLLLLYVICKYADVKNESIKEFCLRSKILKITCGVIVVFTILSLIMPYNLSVETLHFFPKELMVIAFPYYTIVLVVCAVLSYKKNNSDLKKLVYIFLSIGIIFFSFQLIIENVSFIPFMGVTFVYLIYFILENPDLAILNEINDSRENIEKSNQAKTDFLSNMSYEIKMPMNLIISLCDELNNSATFDEQEARENIQQIVDSGNKLLDIINNILDISKIETGKDTLSETDYSVGDIVSNVINVAKQKIGSKQIKLMINIDQSTAAVLHGDSSKVYQSLLNVVLNATKYTEVGRITITLSSTRSNGFEHLLFKVSDTGIGIKDEDKPSIFEKGKKIDSDIFADEGAGLGLAITKQYVDSLGGKIWFESSYRAGSTFYIEIAQKIVDATPIGSAVKTTTNQDEKLDCSAFRALIVDDNMLNIKVAKRLIEKYKFQIDSVTSGKECIDKIKDDEKFDVIFMDHMMPEMDGIETLHVLKRLEGYTIPPVVALTANAIAGMKEMYLNEGFNDYLSKPINVNELDRVINKLFKK